MSAIVFQRYLLATSSIATAIPASGASVVSVLTPVTPLSAKWTIRVRWISGRVVPQDPSGQIVVHSVMLTWALTNVAGTPIFSMIAPLGDYSPAFQFTTASSLNIAMGRSQDFMQTISSLDQVGQTATGIFAQVDATVTNADGAAPHSVIVTNNAILEFESPGSSED